MIYKVKTTTKAKRVRKGGSLRSPLAILVSGPLRFEGLLVSGLGVSQFRESPCLKANVPRDFASPAKNKNE